VPTSGVLAAAAITDQRASEGSQKTAPVYNSSATP